jgi:hypothetical protein
MNNSTLSLSKRTKTFVALGFLCLILSNAIPHDAIGWKITRISLTIFFLVFAGLAYFSKEANRTAKGYLFIALMITIAIFAQLYPILFPLEQINQ